MPAASKPGATACGEQVVAFAGEFVREGDGPVVHAAQRRRIREAVGTAAWVSAAACSRRRDRP